MQSIEKAKPAGREDFYISGFSHELRTKLKQHAKAARRSLTAEILVRLERSAANEAAGKAA